MHRERVDEKKNERKNISRQFERRDSGSEIIIILPRTEEANFEMFSFSPFNFLKKYQIIPI